MTAPVLICVQSQTRLYSASCCLISGLHASWHIAEPDSGLFQILKRGPVHFRKFGVSWDVITHPSKLLLIFKDFQPIKSLILCRRLIRYIYFPLFPLFALNGPRFHSPARKGICFQTRLKSRQNAVCRIYPSFNIICWIKLKKTGKRGINCKQTRDEILQRLNMTSCPRYKNWQKTFQSQVKHPFSQNQLA